MRQKEEDFSDRAVAWLWNTDEDTVFRIRKEMHLFPVYKMIDTCASEFDSYVPYFYSTYEEENESIAEDRKKNSGAWIRSYPNRSGRRV